jgi:hypothetical protein
MKNQLHQEDHTTLIITVFAGALITGALAYLYLTDHGTQTRASLTKKAKDIVRDKASAMISKKTKIPKKVVKKAAKHVR